MPLDRGRAATKQNLRSLFLAAIEITQDALPLFFAHDRAHFGIWIEGMSNRHPLEGLGGMADETVHDFFMHHPARSRATDLSCVERNGASQRLRGAFDID